MKTQVFGDILSTYPPDAVDAFLAYQTTAFGLSRYRMIDTFFERYLGRAAIDGEKDMLLASFSKECRQRYPCQALTEGTMETLETFDRHDIPMFVVSGSDEIELISVLEEMGLARFFRRIFGSPSTKTDNIARVIALLDRPHDITFVGDAKADWLASCERGCDFIYLATWAADPATMQTLQHKHGFKEISRLPDLLEYLALAAPEAAASKDAM
ncbi:HAD hydrolase-like protein [Novosphingobium sp. 2638]|uniref:phosphoglycolate phosphatase n=2 Tax=Novosphingobium beihaiensis TaxID=2930389 RepID=A0ABT0BV79_9SPHN|nr:HAD hydrolase-like protein [Novosphingobium beihaiensis]